MKYFFKKYFMFILSGVIVIGLFIGIYFIPRIFISSEKQTPEIVANNIKSLSDGFELYYKSFDKFPTSILQIDNSIDPEKYGIYYRENNGIIQYIVVTDEQIDYEKLKTQIPEIYSNNIFNIGFEEMYSYLKNAKTVNVMGPPFEKSPYYLSKKTFERVGYDLYPNIYIIIDKTAENIYKGKDLDINIFFYPESFYSL